MKFKSRFIFLIIYSLSLFPLGLYRHTNFYTSAIVEKHFCNTFNFIAHIENVHENGVKQLFVVSWCISTA